MIEKENNLNSEDIQRLTEAVDDFLEMLGNRIAELENFSISKDNSINPLIPSIYCNVAESYF